MKQLSLAFAFIAWMCSPNLHAIVDSVPPMHEENTTCAPDDHNFQVGEKITYVLYYHWGLIWLSAGEVTFEIQERNGEYYLKSIGETYSSYEWFYKVNNKYETYIDKETLLPIRSIRDINEGSYYLYEEVKFDRLNGRAISKRKRKKDEDLKTFVSEIEPCVQDLLSILYATRAAAFKSNFTPGDEVPIPLFLDKEQYDLSLTYRGRVPDKKIKKQGEFDVLQFTPGLIEGELFEEGDEMNIYVTNDKNKLPVMIESPLSVGEVKAVIKEYNGLKYPMQAKVD